MRENERTYTAESAIVNRLPLGEVHVAEVLSVLYPDEGWIPLTNFILRRDTRGDFDSLQHRKVLRVDESQDNPYECYALPDNLRHYLLNVRQIPAAVRGIHVEAGEFFIQHHGSGYPIRAARHFVATGYPKELQLAIHLLGSVWDHLNAGDIGLLKMVVKDIPFDRLPKEEARMVLKIQQDLASLEYRQS